MKEGTQSLSILFSFLLYHMKQKRYEIYANVVFNILDAHPIAIDTGVYSHGKVLNNFFAKLYVHTIGYHGH